MKMNRSIATRGTTSLATKQTNNSGLVYRRNMLEHSEVVNSLTQRENVILLASTKDPISEMDPAEFFDKFKSLVIMIARDVGIKVPSAAGDPNQEGFIYDVSRTSKMIMTYYSHYSMQDLRLAFELLLVGDLDEFLPKDRAGQPDKNHYQQFNAEYMTKVLNAYTRKRDQVITKAHEALPAPTTELTTEQMQANAVARMSAIRDLLKSYSETGVMPPMLGITIMRTYEILSDWGLAKPIEVTDEDRKKALSQLLKAPDQDVNEFDKKHIRRQQEDHPKVDIEAYFVARKNALAETLKEITSTGTDIEPYIKKEIQKYG